MTDSPEFVRPSEPPVVKENRLLSIRLALAQAFTGMWRKAYDALLTHGVNFRTLPAYKDPDGLLDRAYKGDIQSGQGHVLEYIERVESDIEAAVRRKQFRRLDRHEDRE